MQRSLGRFRSHDGAQVYKLTEDALRDLIQEIVEERLAARAAEADEQRMRNITTSGEFPDRREDIRGKEVSPTWATDNQTIASIADLNKFNTRKHSVRDAFGRLAQLFTPNAPRPARDEEGQDLVMPDWFKEFARATDTRFADLQNALDAQAQRKKRKQRDDQREEKESEEKETESEEKESVRDGAFRGSGGLYAQNELHRAGLAAINTKNANLQ